MQVLVVSREREQVIKHPRIPSAPKGTGDLFSAVLTASLLHGTPLLEAAEEACGQVVAAIEHTCRQNCGEFLRPPKPSPTIPSVGYCWRISPSYIEIHFRAWKQSLHMHKALHRITSGLHLHALMLAAMIFSILAVETKRLILSKKPRIDISREKLFGWLSDRVKVLRNRFTEMVFDPRHIYRCKRKRKTLRQNGQGFVP